MEERRAQRPDVAGVRGRAAGCDLGREVGGGAGDQPGLGERGVGLGAGDPEVGQLHLPVAGHQDVRRLHVAVHDAGRVRGGQCVGRLPQQRRGLVGGQGTVAPDQLAQGHPGDVLHDQPPLVALVDEVEDRDHVRVVEPGRQTALALGALQVGGAAAGHHADPLDRDVAAEDLVAGEPDGAHAAAPDLPIECVPACDQVGSSLCRGILSTVNEAARRGKPGGRPPGRYGRLDPDVPDSGRPTRVHRPDSSRRPRVARPDRPLDGPRRAARGPGRGERAVLCGIRPDRAQPAHGQPGPAGHRAAAPERRPHAVRPGRRRDRHDRRPQGLGRAHAQLRGDRQGLDRAGTPPGRAVRVARGRQRGHDGQQLRLDREPLDHRLPARDRQALPGQPDARPRRRAHPPRGRHQLHRVQLHPAAVDGLPRAVPQARRDAAVRRLRPVGQPHRRGRADPSRRRAARRTPSRPRW